MMLRWLERFAALVVLVLAFGVVLACWAPAYVGGRTDDRQGRRWQGERPGPQRGGGFNGGGMRNGPAGRQLPRNLRP